MDFLPVFIGFAIKKYRNSNYQSVGLFRIIKISLWFAEKVGEMVTLINLRLWGIGCVLFDKMYDAWIQAFYFLWVVEVDFYSASELIFSILYFPVTGIEVGHPAGEGKVIYLVPWVWSDRNGCYGLLWVAKGCSGGTDWMSAGLGKTQLRPH